jgi:hypothetical protein
MSAAFDKAAEAALPATSAGGDVGDYFQLLKPRVMSLVIFTALVGIVVAPGARLSTAGVVGVEVDGARNQGVQRLFRIELADAPVARALASFAGVGRRFQHWGDLRCHDGGRFTLIDDYGHHPVEMAAVIAAARGAFPGRRLVLAFQPHRYTRTRDCFEDFVQVMGTADALLLSEVYPAGEAPIVAADGRALARALRVAGRLDPVFVDDIGRMPQAIADFVRDGDVVIAMGAGSIGGVPQKVRDLLVAAAPAPTHSASGGSR